MRVSARVCTDLSRSIKRNWSASAAAIVSILQLPDFCWRWSPCYHLILHHRTTKLFWCLDVCCSSCHHESLTQLEAQGGGAERVEVSVPALDEDSGHGIHARRYLCWFWFFFFLLLAWSLALKRSLGDELMINILWWVCGTAGGKNQQKKNLGLEKGACIRDRRMHAGERGWWFHRWRRRFAGRECGGGNRGHQTTTTTRAEAVTSSHELRKAHGIFRGQSGGCISVAPQTNAREANPRHEGTNVLQNL